MMTGPDILQRYNMFRTAEINGANGPGISTGQALKVMEDLSTGELPPGYGYEWTSIAYQEKEAGGTQGPIFGMAMIFVFLVLAAQYESWAVCSRVLGPIGVCGAFLGVKLAGLQNNVYVQIGIVTPWDWRLKRDPDRGVRQGGPRAEGMICGGARRCDSLRPIMMTALASSSVWSRW
jgi:multidrug efflux pump subunit AcrB